MKKIFCICFLFALALSSCAPGSNITLPPDITLVPGTDIPQQVATFISNALTQTAIPPATSTPVPGVATSPVGSEAGTSSNQIPAGAFSHILYQSSALGIQFSYPSTWYRQETSGGVFLSSFDPSNPPHKLEWRYETTSMQFGFKVFITPPGSFDDWVESARQTAYSNLLTITGEERFSIANQPAHRLSLVSGSGGVINQILTVINGRYLEINVEGNYNNNLARAVSNSIQPFTSSGFKPAEAGTPASGICGDAQGNPVVIALGIAPDGLPKAGRCIAINPAQRIRLINQSDGPLNTIFAEFHIDLPVGGEMLLDKPVGEYLALGVHFIPVGPELWVKDSAAATAPPPIVQYENPVVGYRLGLPGDWLIDENGMTNSLNKEVIFYPPNAEPFITYLSILLDFRALDQIINSYAQYYPDAVRQDTIFNGYTAIKYAFPGGRNEYFIPYGNQIFMIVTERPNDSVVQSILMTVRFTAPPQPVTYDATMADNGRTFVINVGDKLRLNLDLAYVWSTVSISNPAVLAGAGDGYFAFTSGTATLTTTGNPNCLNSTPPCLAPSIMFTITAVVQ